MLTDVAVTGPPRAMRRRARRRRPRARRGWSRCCPAFLRHRLESLQPLDGHQVPASSSHAWRTLHVSACVDRQHQCQAQRARGPRRRRRLLLLDRRAELRAGAARRASAERVAGRPEQRADRRRGRTCAPRRSCRPGPSARRGGRSPRSSAGRNSSPRRQRRECRGLVPLRPSRPVAAPSPRLVERLRSRLYAKSTLGARDRGPVLAA